MGISKKGKRKIIVNDAEYYWYVTFDYDILELGTDKLLTIISEDKKFLIKYPINQSCSGQNLIVVLGKIFGGKGKWGSSWQRLICQKWEIEGKISPFSVEQIIKWSLKDKKIQLVDYKGNLI